MGPRPILQVVPTIVPEQCMVEVMNKNNPNKNCSSWDSVFPVTDQDKKKPLFSKKMAPGNFTCINITGTGYKLGNISRVQCTSITQVPGNFNPIARADVWWWCGDDRLFDRLPSDATGVCALVTLMLPMSLYQMTADRVAILASQADFSELNRQKHVFYSDDPTYIDAIGVPRGVPDEYKLADQIAASFESSAGGAQLIKT